MHIRGPMNISQLAVYTPSGSIATRRNRRSALYRSTVRDASSSELEHMQGHATNAQLNGDRENSAKKRSPNHYLGEGHLQAAAGWGRIAYYTSTAPAEATGLAFLANLGDPRLSGTFDYSFGNSLSYVSASGTSCVSDNTPFDGTLETSEVELTVLTDEVCTGACDYTRPNSTAHHGWEGEEKAFFIEFQMDHYDNVGSDQGMISDAPAWWFLNANIPRTLQYGNDRRNIPCSCWSTGCGEFDAFEVLGRGEERAKSTLHRQGNLEGGDSNYFRRPVGRMLKFAVIFHNYNITAAVLDDDFDFRTALSGGQIDDIVAYDPKSNTHSLFAIGT
ncbi:putative TOS1-like glycosyl hydrolase-domain-containing protein [Clohesyomyces aquaticus]|uniref:Putative TOS1-like glycosyl hydrolase-domain-containing protein n=1 Tax=Clohesyomyces aquaticus TaxID=1231657 RepID=A0A1Y2ABN4_9PLEO|nr:putative TOS1-like glycosyl hydrolase-domain-containing protein [Clohesyomyces aquaticus]